MVHVLFQKLSAHCSLVKPLLANFPQAAGNFLCHGFGSVLWHACLTRAIFFDTCLMRIAAEFPPKRVMARPTAARRSSGSLLQPDPPDIPAAHVGTKAPIGYSFNSGPMQYMCFDICTELGTNGAAVADPCCCLADQYWLRLSGTASMCLVCCCGALNSYRPSATQSSHQPMSLYGSVTWCQQMAVQQSSSRPFRARSTSSVHARNARHT